jgi:pimeloyl-ACP methyl ester carboxylesterase
MRAAFTDVRGVRTRFLTAGEGLPLLLVHGVGLSADAFLRNLEPLGKHFRVYAPDLVGHGFTDAVSFEGRAPQRVAVEHLEAFMDAMGGGPCAVLGFSYGALIASLMWFSRPRQVTSLVLVGSGSVFHPPELGKQTSKAAFENGSAAMRDPDMDLCRKRLAAICYDPHAVPEEMLLSQMTSYALPDRLSAYQATIDGSVAHVESETERVFTRLDAIEVPTLILTGRQDPRANVEWHMKGAARIKGSRLTIFEECGHLPFIEHPEKFNGEVTSFLRANQSWR